MFYLPSHSSELNPNERLNADLNDKRSQADAGGTSEEGEGVHGHGEVVARTGNVLLQRQARVLCDRIHLIYCRSNK